MQMVLDTRSFDEFRALVYKVSGISLGTNKEALVSSRIGKRMRHLGMEEFSAYLDLVKGNPGGDEMVQLLDAISTNVTSFFRESQHFDLVRELFSGWLKDGQRRFRFWSAACSTGEEPYTLAMTLAETLAGQEVDIKILATDISTRVLAHAAEGEYPEAKLAGIPSGLRAKYFQRGPGRDADFRVKDQLKRWIVFKRFNLSTPPFPMQGPMDIVLCRNVMIYFDNKTREALVGEIHRMLKPGGHLMVGHAESLTGIRTELANVRPSVYIKGNR
jgi:chemotaxis protein methyltransferase CheR